MDNYSGLVQLKTVLGRSTQVHTVRVTVVGCRLTWKRVRDGARGYGCGFGNLAVGSLQDLGFLRVCGGGFVVLYEDWRDAT